jgi:hypothetical protein
MIQARNRLRFTLETLSPRWIFSKVFRQNLDRDVPIQTLVTGTVYLPHPTLADLFDDAVRAEAATDEISHF